MALITVEEKFEGGTPGGVITTSNTVLSGVDATLRFTSAPAIDTLAAEVVLGTAFPFHNSEARFFIGDSEDPAPIVSGSGRFRSSYAAVVIGGGGFQTPYWIETTLGNYYLTTVDVGPISTWRQYPRFRTNAGTSAQYPDLTIPSGQWLTFWFEQEGAALSAGIKLEDGTELVSHVWTLAEGEHVVRTHHTVVAADQSTTCWRMDNLKWTYGTPDPSITGSGDDVRRRFVRPQRRF